MTGCRDQRRPTRALPGSWHDVAAARQHGILDTLAKAGISTVADIGYQGASPAVRVRQRWLHHIGTGRSPRLNPRPATHPRPRHIRVINEHTGELLREPVLGSTRDYQPLGHRPGPSNQKPPIR